MRLQSLIVEVLGEQRRHVRRTDVDADTGEVVSESEVLSGLEGFAREFGAFASRVARGELEMEEARGLGDGEKGRRGGSVRALDMLTRDEECRRERTQAAA